MATVALRLDDETNDELETVARGRGVTKSDLLREAIATILDRRTKRTYGGTPQSLTAVERKILAQQHEILATLSDDENDKAFHASRVTVLNNGYVAEYSDEFLYMDSELSREDCTLVMDILDMFRVLRASVDQMTDQDRSVLGDSVLRQTRFGGFDLNDRFEGELHGYAKYLIEQGKWSEQAERFGPTHDGGNSHARTVPTYQRMLSAFQPIWDTVIHNDRGDRDGYVLNADEVKTVVEARKYPATAS